MQRCVIYARVSLEDQLQKYGLPSQLRACREYAKEHGYKVSAEISDEGISGATMDRPGLERLRTMVRQGSIDVVLSFDADRISRELAHLLILKPEIERSARMEFVAAKFEDSASGRMFFGIRGVISQYERELLKERTLRGRKEKARQGHIVGGRIPYGYNYVGKASGERGRYTVNEEQAAVVRQIFTWADSGESVRSIARRLNESGIPSCASEKWMHSSIGRLLNSERYAGVSYYNRSKRAGAVLRPREESDWISVPVPPIIDRELWDRVVSRLRSNRKALAGRPTRRYMLRGLLRCKCGSRMFGNPNRGKPIYRCGDMCCRISAEKVDAAVWRAVSGPFSDARKLRALVEQHIAALTSGDGAKKREKLRAQIGKLQAKEFRATRALLDSDLLDHYETIKRQLAEVREQRRKCEAELAEIESACGMAHSAVATVDGITAEISRALPLFSPEQRLEFLRRVVDHVEFSGSELVIHCFFVAQYCPEHGDVVVNIEQLKTRRIPFVIREKVA